MGKGLLGQEFQGGVVVNIAVLDDAAVAVVGVFAHADIGDYRQVRYLLLQGPDRFLDDPGIGVGVAADSVLGFRNSEENDRRNPQLMDLLGLGDDILDGLLVDPRH